MSKPKTTVTIILATLLSAWTLSHFVSIAINISESLPYRAFVVLKGMPAKKLEYAAFYAPHNGVYADNKMFIKQIAGVSGDMVTVDDRNFFVNGRFMGHAKAISKRGVPLAIGPTGKIAQNRYFVHAVSQRQFRFTV